MAEQCCLRTKTAIEQMLLLRGGRDFDDESAYLRFVRTVVGRERNARAAARPAEERAYLQPLPPARIPEHTTFQCRVASSGVWCGSRAPSRGIVTLAAGAFLETATNVLAFGLPGVGKSHALCAVGHALVEAGHSVLCAPAYQPVVEPRVAPRAARRPADKA